MIIYYYDENTLQYTHQGTARPSPLQPGVWLVPANATDEPPTEESPRWRKEGEKFFFVPPPPPEEVIVREPELPPEAKVVARFWRYNVRTKAYAGEWFARASPLDLAQGRLVALIPAPGETTVTTVPLPVTKAPYGTEIWFDEAAQDWATRPLPFIDEDTERGAEVRAQVYEDVQRDAMAELTAELDAIDTEKRLRCLLHLEKKLDADFQNKRQLLLWQMEIERVTPKNREFFAWEFFQKYTRS